jgi:hypothetical protein
MGELMGSLLYAIAVMLGIFALLALAAIAVLIGLSIWWFRKG